MHVTYYTADSALGTYTLNVWLVAFIVLILTVMCRLKHKRRKSDTETSRSDPSALRFGGFLQVFVRVLPMSKAVFVYSSVVFRNFLKRGNVVISRKKRDKPR